MTPSPPSVASRLLEMFAVPYDHEKAIVLMSDFLPYSLAASLVYIVVVFSLQRLMLNRKPFSLKWPLVFWNAGLAVFSVLGSYYSTVDVIEMAMEHSSLSATYCLLGTAMTGKNGFWGYLFTLSKLAEFGDTLFIVLRKKPLIFLHYYHHVVTLNFTVFGYAGNNAFTVWLLWLNYLVHSVMYLYYMLSAMGIQPPRAISKTITCMQLAQFAISLFFFAHIGYLKYFYGLCDFHTSAYVIGVVMEISYVILFAQFFHNAYVKMSAKRVTPAKKMK
ncbi:hypothetical protein QR680_016538 [Steinernema hermaphroditum]|uniref:Elongation of very long chain fatty acids protein n=1 Tax=Steinernema hermaphroditum TaxID=289476 RepID=A0AA39LML7_9BILA|nr:hypothetical protein QR680_016538 [Steinernema hermaphroditum]